MSKIYARSTTKEQILGSQKRVSFSSVPAVIPIKSTAKKYLESSRPLYVSWTMRLLSLPATRGEKDFWKDGFGPFDLQERSWTLGTASIGHYTRQKWNHPDADLTDIFAYCRNAFLREKDIAHWFLTLLDNKSFLNLDGKQRDNPTSAKKELCLPWEAFHHLYCRY